MRASGKSVAVNVHVRNFLALGGLAARSRFLSAIDDAGPHHLHANPHKAWWHVISASRLPQVDCEDEYIQDVSRYALF